jgi:hypothetical protein
MVPPIAIDPKPIVMVEENFMSTEKQKIVDEVVKSLISEVKEQKQPQATFEDVDEKKDEPITLSLE